MVFLAISIVMCLPLGRAFVTGVGAGVGVATGGRTDTGTFLPVLAAAGYVAGFAAAYLAFFASASAAAFALAS